MRRALRLPDVTSAAEKYQNIFTTHSVDVLGFEAELQKQVLGILKRLETDLIAAIAKIDVGGVTAPSYKKARLQALLQQTRTSIRTAYSEASTTTRTQLYGLAKTESDFTAGALNKAIGLDVATVALTPEALRALAQGTLIDGAASNKWWVKQSRNTEHRFERAMQTGTSQGEALGDLVKRVRGTKENNYTDGIMVASRREAQALVRTSVQATANAASEATYATNDDVVKGLLWVSTMDSRITEICIVHSGKQYTLDHRPVGHDVPWGAGPGRIHWGCRSKSLPILKSWNELGAKGAIRTGGRPSDIRAMFEKQLIAKGMSPEQIAAAKLNMRASLAGQVPEDITFEAWLKKRPLAFQEELLGKGKAELFRNGEISTNDLLDQRGRVRTLEQLQVLAAQMREEMGAAIVGPSGLSKREFFKQTMEEQFAKKLTDEQLQLVWDTEFPSEQFGTRYLVKDMRSAYNRGAWGAPPGVPIHQYGEGGKILKLGKVPGVKPLPPVVPPVPPEPPVVPKLPGTAKPENYKSLQKNIHKAVEESPGRMTHGQTSKNAFWVVDDQVYPFNKWEEIPVEKRKLAISVHSHSADAGVEIGKLEEFQPLNAADIKGWLKNIRTGIAGNQDVIIMADGRMEVLEFTAVSDRSVLNLSMKQLEDALHRPYDERLVYFKLHGQEVGYSTYQQERELLREFAKKYNINYYENLNWKTIPVDTEVERAFETAAKAAKALEGTRYGVVKKIAAEGRIALDKMEAEIKTLQDANEPLRIKVWDSGPGSFRYGSPEWKVAEAELEAKRAPVHVLKAERDKFLEQLDKDMLAALQRTEAEALPLTVNWTHSTGAASKQWFDEVKAGIADFRALVDPSVIQRAEVNIEYLPKIFRGGKKVVARAFYRNAETAAYLAEGAVSPENITVHELGHFIEHVNPRARREAQAFLRQRTEGEKLTRIYKYIRGNKEVGWKDKFMDHYAGRHYEWGTTEIISMGMQWLRQCPLKFFQEDPEYFELMMKIVGNIPW